ncbi:MAG: (d)CMP kinase [Sandaracinaceae bacterium]|nr:(d)CMP kinase [Sandaracinaceae bacterium]
MIVAIDGPAGAGKSTLSRRVADKLGYTLVDTGALYRAVALWARRRGIAWDDGAALGAMTATLGFAFVDGALEVDGERPGDALRTSETSTGASRVSAHPEVRAALLGVQRDLGRDGGVVLEGRDIGTVVYPDAEVKVFLVATDEERARRRLAELLARGEASTFEGVLEEIRARDKRDEERAVAPLRMAKGAVRLDTTGRSLDSLVEELAAIVARAATH